jgi:hypothetical protein
LFFAALGLKPAKRFHPPTVFLSVLGISILTAATGADAGTAAGAAADSGVLGIGAGTGVGTDAVSVGLLFNSSIVISFGFIEL